MVSLKAKNIGFPLFLKATHSFERLMHHVFEFFSTYGVDRENDDPVLFGNLHTQTRRSTYTG